MWLHPSCCLHAPEGELGFPAPPAPSPASSQREGPVTCCNLAYFESSSLALHAAPSAKSERSGGRREEESGRAAEVRDSLPSEVEPLNAPLTIAKLSLVVFCQIKAFLEGPQADSCWSRCSQSCAVALDFPPRPLSSAEEL